MGNMLRALSGINKTTEVTVESPLHGMVVGSTFKQDKIVKDITSVLGKEIRFYKNKLFPLVRDNVASIKRGIDTALKNESYTPVLKTFNIPKFISSDLNATLLMPKIDSKRAIKVYLPSTIEVDTLVTMLDVSIEKEKNMLEFISGIKSSVINKAYRHYIVDTTFDVHSLFRSYGDIEEIYMAYVIIYLMKRAPALGKGDLNDYSYYMDVKRIMLFNHLINVTTSFIALEKKGTIILSKSSDRSSATVSSKNMNIYYQNGGVIEVLFGAIRDLRYKMSVEEITTNSERYLAKWKEFSMEEEVRMDSLRKDIAIKAYQESAMLGHGEISDKGVSIIDLTFTDFLRKRSVVKLYDVVDTMEEFVFDILLKDTNAKFFVETLKFYMEQTKDMEVAVSLTTSRFVLRYLTKGIVLKDK